MRSSEYMAKIDAMESGHLAWLLKFQPVIITAERANQMPAEKVWSAGYLRGTGEYLILTGPVYGEWEPEVWYFSQTPAQENTSNYIVYRDEAPCLVCNAGYDSEHDESSALDVDCKNCKGAGWAIFDCINEPEYEALMNELENSDNEEITDYLEHYLEMHNPRKNGM